MKKFSKIVKKRTGVLELVEDRVMVSLEHIGEGYQGDYNDSDPEDAPLLRMDVSVRSSVKNTYSEDGSKGWNSMSNSSYCTSLPESNEVAARHALRYIMKMVKRPTLKGESIKRICERLSHLSPSDFDKRGRCTLASF